MWNGLDQLIDDHHQRYLGLGIIGLAGVVMGLMEIQHIQKMSSTVGIAIFAVLPFIVNLGLIGAVGVLWRSRFDGGQTLRIAGWVLLGMAMLGLLATWTITHQNIRGRSFAHAPFVTVNNLSAGGMIGLLIGWYDTRGKCHQQAADNERQKLKFLNRTLRHNVLNSVNIISGNVELLEETVNDSAQKYLDPIRTRAEEVARFAKGTNILMENSLAESSEQFYALDLAAVLTDVIEKARLSYDQAEITADLPEGVEIMADDYVTELFENPLMNAILHNDKSTPEVQITATPQSDSVVVEIADNGPGIPDDQKQRLMEWNAKGSQSTGTGLGLAIADTVAERYDGTLWIEDNQPAGTVVKIELPTANAGEIGAREANG